MSSVETEGSVVVSGGVEAKGDAELILSSATEVFLNHYFIIIRVRLILVKSV